MDFYKVIENRTSNKSYKSTPIPEEKLDKINNRVLKYVATLMEEGFFDYYMQRYDYMLRCFDKGNELFEAGAAND